MLTFGAVNYSVHNAKKIAQKEFALICNDIKTKISERLHAHALLLRSGAAFFAASDSVERLEWKAFVSHEQIKKNLNGIQGFGFSMIIPKRELDNHIRSIKNEGFPDYKVKPAGDRDIYTSIIYLEPFSGRNLRAFGYDMFSEDRKSTRLNSSH